MELEFITSNDHKYEEMKEKLDGLDITLIHRKMSYPEIQADKILDVARYSLSLMVPVINNNFLLEDAGLKIEALDGFPGPYSSFVFSTIGWQGILRLLSDDSDRSATFISVIGLYHNGRMEFFEGKTEGRIATEASSGSYGFGFDPIFIPEGYEVTFADMPLEEKNTISHRAQSTDLLVDYLSTIDF